MELYYSLATTSACNLTNSEAKMNWKKTTAAVLAAVAIASGTVGASAATAAGTACNLPANGGSTCSVKTVDCYTPAPKAGETWWFAPAAPSKTADTTCTTGSSCDKGTSCNTNTTSNTCDKTNTDCTADACGDKAACNNGAACAPGNTCTPEKPCQGTDCDAANPDEPCTGANCGSGETEEPTNPGEEQTSGYASELELKMVALVNAERTAQGLKPLKVNDELTKVAREKSKDMIANNYFSHTSPTYGSPFDMMKAFGIKYTTAGENIAYNSSIEAAHTALMNSEGHRANILKSNFTEIGLGVAQSGSRVYVTQMFIG